MWRLVVLCGHGPSEPCPPWSQAPSSRGETSWPKQGPAFARRESVSRRSGRLLWAVPSAAPLTPPAHLARTRWGGAAGRTVGTGNPACPPPQLCRARVSAGLSWAPGQRVRSSTRGLGLQTTDPRDRCVG